MESLWSVYHQDIPPFLLQLAAAAPMQRLRQVGMNCGCEYTSFPRFRCLPSYSRYDHSLGVGLIVWHFTGDAAQAAAGLLHDVATPVFAHTPEDLQTPEPEVIARLESDRVCAPLWAAFRACSQICSMPDRPVQGRWLQVPAKLRCIDPLCRGLGRVSAWHSEFARELKRFRALPLDGWLGPFPF